MGRSRVGKGDKAVVKRDIGKDKRNPFGTSHKVVDEDEMMNKVKLDDGRWYDQSEVQGTQH